MKPITESALRIELRNSQPDVYYVPAGCILTPAAREYLQQRKIKFAKEGEVVKSDEPHVVATEVPKPEPVVIQTEQPKPKYVDFETGAFYMTKPEFMTQLFGNKLVPKNHPRILFRGKLDSLQSLVVLDQVLVEGNEKLVADLEDILHVLREIMRCDVLDEEYKGETIIGFNHDELRERSHFPQKYFNIKQMVLPDKSMGKEYALLNQLRTAVRETEVAAVDAFSDGKKFTRGDIIEELNRLSSAVHIMMCMHLAGMYQ